MDWYLSALLIAVYYFAGSKKWWSWGLAILSAASWIVYAVRIDQLGLIPSSVFVLAISIRNIIKWRREEAEDV